MEISTRSAQKEMVFPSLLAIAIPIVVGMLLGVAGVMGLLVGGLTAGFTLAVFMANAGGAWDNAKKMVEEGNFGGKGSELATPWATHLRIRVVRRSISSLNSCRW